MRHEHTEDSHTKLTPERLEAFSDGVLAIIITITVLGLRVPQGSSLAALKPLLPLFLTYLISFQTVGTYWNNHHHLLRATRHISADIMWANLNLLFWLSLIPFAAGWLGENHGGKIPTATYAAVLLCCSLAYGILQYFVLSHADNQKEIREEFSKSKKGAISLVSYSLAVGLAFINPVIADVLIVFVALLWFVPDRRLERII